MSAAAARPLRVAVLFTSVFEAIKDLQEEHREEMDLEVNARTVADTLRSCGHEAWPHAFGKDAGELVSALAVMKPDAVFNLSECPFLSPEKELHACALLELLRLPYTGNGPLVLGICNSKSLTKQLLSANDIPTPPFRLYTAEPDRDPDIPYPLVVKPANEDGSAGITEDSFVRELEGLRRQVKWLRDGFRQNALVEKFVGGREFNVGLLGNGTAADPHRSLPPAELVYRNPRWRLCTYESKWVSTHPSYTEIAAVCPAEAPPELIGRLSRIALECARVFRLAGYARVDFRMDEQGELYVLEVNPNPDISPDAGMPRAARAAGIPYPELVHEILRLGFALGAR
ncbi:MAG: ATP-grasp domain-containing protein [Deltaproteobacteria bacterium]|nr:ATP-grasp domain-containing protein [Deltaproteobacteria bacterium]